MKVEWHTVFLQQLNCLLVENNLLVPVIMNVWWCALWSLIAVFFCVHQTVGFVWGYVCQQFSQTILILLAGFVLACLVCTVILIIHPLLHFAVSALMLLVGCQ